MNIFGAQGKKLAGTEKTVEAQPYHDAQRELIMKDAPREKGRCKTSRQGRGAARGLNFSPCSKEAPGMMELTPALGPKMLHARQGITNSSQRQPLAPSQVNPI